MLFRSSQASATREIAEGASKTALNAGTLSDTFKTIEETTKSTRQAAGSVLEVARDLTAHAQQIEAAIEKLLEFASQGPAIRRLADLSVKTN